MRRFSTAGSSALFRTDGGCRSPRIGHVRLDVARRRRAGESMIYPVGFHWAADMKPVTGTDAVHARTSDFSRGEIHIEYADGCIVELRAPQVVAIDPGHDGWVVGKNRS